MQQSKTEHSKTEHSKAAQLPSDQLQTEKQQASAAASGYGIDEVRALAEVFGVSELQLIKPGIGETTRVLLRRVPWKVLIDARYRNNPELGHIVRLAEEKQVPIEFIRSGIASAAASSRS